MLFRSTTPDRPLPANAIRVPFLLVPRGESKVSVGGLRRQSIVRPGVGWWTAKVSNRGVHSGYADVYALQLTDREHDAERGLDVASVGIQSFDLSLDRPATGPDAMMVLAVNQSSQRSTAASTEYDVLIDTNGDNDPEYIVIGIDPGWITDGSETGSFASIVINALDGTVTGAWLADAPFNGSTVLLPFLASNIGLDLEHPSFRYSVTAYDFSNWGTDEVRGWASWNPFDPPVLTGQGVELEPRASDVLWFGGMDRKSARRAGVKGYLVVTLDNRNGTDQAEIVGLPG